ncbi:caspase family protein [Rubrimonas cliftonensis]|uniref:Caspase domain-containing protein n=1 Tax=Rubrimonas cliftonensis TaxID=89524 RepID=A0A1H4E042_9RHOB|nr:caspase family protein [Rubrimonas cliftonensis]SEA77792.1 Caspase domain-containing protein [Rubrimonas cliftonensis]
MFLRKMPGIFAALALLALATAAKAEERIALVVGNGDYASVSPLPNPTADARLIAGALEAAGFDVTLALDLDQNAMKRAIAEFGRSLRAVGPDGVSLFYYAGHGVQASGANYLIPVDAAITDAADLDLAAVEASWVIRQMASARSRTAIAIFDACRDNPFARIGLREPGLARMDAPAGSFIAYATAPGDAAFDGDGANSPFSAALAREALNPGAPLEEVFRQVRVDVINATGGRQTPWTSSSLIDDFRFVGAPEADPVDPAEKMLFESARKSGDIVELALFLRAYPDSAFAEEARGLIVASTSGVAPPAPQVAPPQPAPVPAAPALAPASAAPFLAPDEETLIAVAQASGALADYRAYLDAYPEGVFAALAAAEIAALSAAPPSNLDPERPSADALAALAPPAPAPPPPAAQQGAGLSFTTPLPSAYGDVAGRSFAELIEGRPEHPPFEGLPAEVWQGNRCKDCHAWTQPALCDQGAFYAKGEGDERVAQQVHPLGTGFARALRDWSLAGCP